MLTMHTEVSVLFRDPNKVDNPLPYFRYFSDSVYLTLNILL